MSLKKSIIQKLTWKLVLTLFCTSAILGTCIITEFFGFLHLDSNATMDSLTYYTGSTFFSNLELQGESGRKSYLLPHLIDYLFISQFYLFLFSLLTLMAQKVSHTKGIMFLGIFPILSAVMDLLENICIDVSILLYPERIILHGQISGIFTFIKMHTIYFIFILIGILLIIQMLQSLKKAIGANEN